MKIRYIALALLACQAALAADVRADEIDIDKSIHLTADKIDIAPTGRVGIADVRVGKGHAVLPREVLL